MIQYRLRSQRKKAAEEQAQKNPVNDPDRLRKIRRASTKDRRANIYFLMWFSPGQVRTNQKSKKQNQKILKKVLDKSAKPLYC